MRETLTKDTATFGNALRSISCIWATPITHTTGHQPLHAYVENLKLELHPNIYTLPCVAWSELAGHK